MFFGSGNLVFPLLVGQMSAGHYLSATLGILLTGVIVPFMGILAMILFNGDSNAFFQRLGKPAKFWFPLIALSLMGPFGVLARCITVAHGAFRLVSPTTELWLFSLVSCALIFFLTIKKNKIVPLLGSVLTPLLLLSLASIAFFGLTNTGLPEISGSDLWAPFKYGFLQGYQTMDLLAAFFFSVFVLQHLKAHQAMTDHPTSALPIFFKASLIGAGLLSSIYFILVLLGATYAPELAHIAPTELLGYIATQTLGSWAAPVVSVAVLLACLTTAIVLASLFADFLKQEIARQKISSSCSLFITLLIAFCISTLQFSGIMRFICPILELIYPALIVLTIVSIFHKLFGLKIIRMPVAIAIVLKLLSTV